MKTLLAGIRSNLNDILKIRDDIGAVKDPVFIVTRTWMGSEPGDGYYTDRVEQVLPSPRIVKYVDDYRIKEGGAVQQGDVMLKMISQQSYPNQTDVDCSVPARNVERFYRLGSDHYQVIQVEKHYLTWNVFLRRLSRNG